MGEGPVNGAARTASWRTGGVGGQHFWGRDRKEPGLAGRDVGIRTAVRLTTLAQGLVCGVWAGTQAPPAPGSTPGWMPEAVSSRF